MAVREDGGMGAGLRNDKTRREGGFVVDRLILSVSATRLAVCSVFVCAVCARVHQELFRRTLS